MIERRAVGDDADRRAQRVVQIGALDRDHGIQPRQRKAGIIAEEVRQPGQLCTGLVDRAAIVERGWNERAGAFTQAFGSEDLDASCLMLAITGFLPGDDTRMRATIDAIAQRLTDKRGLVYR